MLLGDFVTGVAATATGLPSQDSSLRRGMTSRFTLMISWPAGRHSSVFVSIMSVPRNHSTPLRPKAMPVLADHRLRLKLPAPARPEVADSQV